MFTLLLVVIAIALLFDLVNGFHDAANSIATVVSTKVLTPFQAVLWAAAFNVLAFWVFDMSVGNTVAKTVDSGAIDLWVILAGLLAAAPLIGGVIAFVIALVTMSRQFILKFFVIIGGSIGLYFLMEYMVEYMDMKPIMMYIVLVMLGIFILAYIYYMLVHGKKQTAIKESNMYKKLQLLSSAAFSLGHGGADSQKVMGIICAALMVYGNMEREGKLSSPISEHFKVTELMQIEYTNKDGKHEKFKPLVGSVDSVVYYSDGKNIIDAKTQELIFKEEKINSTYKFASQFSSYAKTEESLNKLKVYSKGDDIFDDSLNQLIFHKNELNPKYSNAGLFANYISNGELKDGYKLKTKVNSDFPGWISFGCYLMIGLGTLFGGWKIVKTMGSKITKVTPLEGVCAETAGALTLFTVSQMGIPVSTTHTITGSIIGVGATKRLSAVRWGVTINLLWAWVLTIPVSALFAAIFYYLICLFK